MTTEEHSTAQPVLYSYGDLRSTAQHSKAQHNSIRRPLGVERTWEGGAGGAGDQKSEENEPQVRRIEECDQDSNVLQVSNMSIISCPCTNMQKTLRIIFSSTQLPVHGEHE